MQDSWNERIRKVQPYKDIVKQVNEDFHGVGFVKRARGGPKFLRPGEKKFRPTALDNQAEALLYSHCLKYGQAPLSKPELFPRPDYKYPEIAFIGRSNVGKSSLLNKVARFGTVAKVSPMPGQTKHVTWYRNTKMKLDIVDMPGYGFANRAQLFGPAAIEFVKSRTSLRALYVLIDARHGFKRSDHEWLGELGKVGPMKQIILTKTDLVPPNQLIKIASLVKSDLEGHSRIDQNILLVSTPYGMGLHEVRKSICERCGRQQRRARGDEPLFLAEGEGELPSPGAPGLGLLPAERSSPGDDGWGEVLDDEDPDRAALEKMIAESARDDPIRDPTSDIRKVVRGVRKGRRHI